MINQAGIFWVVPERITKSIQGSTFQINRNKNFLRMRVDGQWQGLLWLLDYEYRNVPHQGPGASTSTPCILWPWVWIAHMWTSQDTVLLNPLAAWILNSKSLTDSSQIVSKSIQFQGSLNQSLNHRCLIVNSSCASTNWMRIQKVEKDSTLIHLHGFTSMIKQDKSVSADLCILEKQT